jgi:hypothetical protein
LNLVDRLNAAHALDALVVITIQREALIPYLMGKLNVVGHLKDTKIIGDALQRAVA